MIEKEKRMNSYLVVGTGVSGVAAVLLLQKEGAEVCVFDGNSNLDEAGLILKHPELEGVPIYIGELPEDVRDRCDTLILSPGVPVDSPLVEDMRARGKRIWGEVELAYRLGHGHLAAITGTNGKTTTTSMVGVILKTYFSDVEVVGNIGTPYTGVAADTKDDTRIVAEISSFQLETIDRFHPSVSAILNITPDHLNRHHTMENYIACKERIAKNQTPDETVVLNLEDSVLREFGKSLPNRVVWFSSKRKLREGYYYREEDRSIYYCHDGIEEKILPVEELQLVGRHNYENAMAAAAIARAMGVPMDKVREGLKAFTAVEHRIEYVCTKRGVRYYNDSKGTNPDAAIKGILAMDSPTCLIGGGYDKKSDYGEWIDNFKGRVKLLVLIGETRSKIAKCCQDHGFEAFVYAETLEEAVRICYESARAGEEVLLSPACASWDMFHNYEERGRLFKKYVRELPD